MADNLTPEQRRRCMVRNKSRNTGLEKRVCKVMRNAGLRFRRHAADLPGRPDAVFRKERVAVFIDGDFWHGWRFPQWAESLAPAWREKIEKNRLRDRRNAARLRRAGWCVIRVWEHQAARDADLYLSRIVEVVRYRSKEAHEKT